MKKLFVMLSALLLLASSVCANDISFDRKNYGGNVLLWPFWGIYTGASGYYKMGTDLNITIMDQTSPIVVAGPSFDVGFWTLGAYSSFYLGLGASGEVLFPLKNFKINYFGYDWYPTPALDITATYYLTGFPDTSIRSIWRPLADFGFAFSVNPRITVMSDYEKGSSGLSFDFWPYPLMVGFSYWQN